MNNIKDLFREVLLDAAKGHLHPLIGFIDYLLVDKGYPLHRLIRIAERRYKIPRHVTVATLQYLV